MENKREKYARLIAFAKTLPPTPTAIAHPCDESSLRGAVEAAQLGLIQPILVGPSDRIVAVAGESGLDIADLQLVDAPHSHAAADTAVRLVREGRAQALMKGSLHTDELMSAVVAHDTGLRTARRISHCFVMDVPGHDDPLIITDAAVNIAPSLDDKAHIIQNAIDLAHVLGIAEPKVAILSAVETVNPKIESTLHAAALCKMADRGQITAAQLDGPLAFDNAISMDAVRIKGIASEVAGQADILVVPDLESGNMVAKQLEYLAGASGSGLVLGARVPIALTSRADGPAARVASTVLAVLAAHDQRRKRAANAWKQG